ncbi:MAG: AI-2E family transporter [Planctomycetota bacterium]
MSSLTEEKVQTICMLILTSIAVAASLKVFSSVLIPFVLAIFLTFCVSPLIDIQIKWLRVPRFVAIVTTIFLAVTFVFMLGLIVSAAAGEMAEHREEYLTQVSLLFDRMFDRLSLDRFGLEADKLLDSMADIGAKTTRKVFSRAVKEVMNVVSNGLLVLVFTIFMLTGRGHYRYSGSKVHNEIKANIKRYALSMMLTSGLTGLLVGSVLFILGIRFAWMFGFLAFLLNFIPNIGSVIATLLPVPVVILSTQLSPAARILAIVIPAAIQFSIGNLIQPRLLGRSLNLHPVAVLLSLIFFGAIWGMIVGMFLAAPIAVVLRILLERFEHTAPVADLLAAGSETPAT